jgi:hypothetical protein
MTCLCYFVLRYVMFCYVRVNVKHFSTMRDLRSSELCERLKTCGVRRLADWQLPNYRRSLLSMPSVSQPSEKTKLNLNSNKTSIAERICWMVSAARERNSFLLLKITSSLLKKVHVKIKTFSSYQSQNL